MPDTVKLAEFPCVTFSARIEQHQNGDTMYFSVFTTPEAGRECNNLLGTFDTYRNACIAAGEEMAHRMGKVQG